MNKNLTLNIRERRERDLYIADFTVNFAFKTYKLFELSDGLKYFPSEIKDLFYDCSIANLSDLPLYQLNIFDLKNFEDVFIALKDTFSWIRTFKKIGFEIVDDMNGEVYDYKISDIFNDLENLTFSEIEKKINN
jgi:hypothetical protein